MPLARISHWKGVQVNLLGDYGNLRQVVAGGGNEDNKEPDKHTTIIIIVSY
jgi:hypothetical protein